MNAIRPLIDWTQIVDACAKINPPNTILTHFKTKNGNGYTTSIEQTTEDLVKCYDDLALVQYPKVASQLLSITTALHLHLL